MKNKDTKFEFLIGNDQKDIAPRYKSYSWLHFNVGAGKTTSIAIPSYFAQGFDDRLLGKPWEDDNDE